MKAGEKSIEVLHAPDYRNANNYQSLLASALNHEGVSGVFAEGYRRIFPLTRVVKEKRPDILHLHWPEAYFSAPSKGHSLVRALRFRADLAQASRFCPIVWTVHNISPHHTFWKSASEVNMQFVAKTAKKLICHSNWVATCVKNTFGVESDKIMTISHGDNTHLIGKSDAELTESMSRIESSKVVYFGRIAKYKNIEKIIEAADEAFSNSGKQLVICGTADDQEYFRKLQDVASNCPWVEIRNAYLSEADLRDLVKSSIACVFAHSIQSSGSVLYARLLGRPVVVPSTFPGLPVAYDLDDPGVIKHDFNRSLSGAIEKLSTLCNDEIRGAYQDLKKTTCWKSVAGEHARLYRTVLDEQAVEVGHG